MVDDIRRRSPKFSDEGQNKDFENIAPPPEVDDEVAFVPPEVIAEKESTDDGLRNDEEGFALIAKEKPNQTTELKHKTPLHKLHFHFKHASKKHKLIGIAIALTLLTAGGGAAYAINKHFSKPPIAPPTSAKPVPKKEEPKPTTEASRLTGIQIDPALNKRPVTSIQIENSPDARPQSGLKDAGVVYEAIAEGGITRFNASFLEAQPDYIGPVRSVRPYYAVLASPFDPIFVHAGGSADGLAKLRELGLKDLDHGANGAAFRRISERYAPHNLYTSMADLDRASAGRGYNSSDVKGFLRKAEKPNQPVAARAIDFTMSSALYNVHYDYDATTNTYKRSEGGKPHVDYKSNEQLAPKVVVALVMNYSQNGIYSVYQTTGQGTVFVFQDGQVQQGTWSKASDKEQLVFTGSDGKPLALNAGQTWFTLVKTNADVHNTP